MKTNHIIIPTKYNWSWHKWEEHCDKCGNQTKSHSWRHSKEPDLAEEDYCLDCLREMLENKIS